MSENVSMNGRFLFGERDDYFNDMPPNRMTSPNKPNMPNMSNMPDMSNMPYSERDNVQFGEYSNNKYSIPTGSRMHMEQPAKKHQRKSDFSNTPLDQLPLTMAYTPMQRLGKMLEPEAALEAGTLFPELEKPFLGARWNA